MLGSLGLGSGGKRFDLELKIQCVGVRIGGDRFGVIWEALNNLNSFCFVFFVFLGGISYYNYSKAP